MRSIANLSTRKTFSSGFRCVRAFSSGADTIRVVLDWTPNTNHMGFCVAQQQGLYKAKGLKVQFVLPEDLPKGSSPARSVAEGKNTFALAPSESAISFATTDDPRTPKLQAVAALLQGSTHAICTLASSGISRPRELDGKRYASYGGRFEDRQVQEMVKADGGKGDVKFHNLASFAYGDGETMHAGSVVASFLQKGKSDSTWIFTHWEGLLATRAGQKLNMFKLEDFGIPYGYSPVLLACPSTLATRSKEARAFLAATAEGYSRASKDPDAAAKDLLTQFGSHSSMASLGKGHEEFVKQSARQLAPMILSKDGSWGRMDPLRWKKFLEFLSKYGILTDRAGKLIPVSSINPDGLFTNSVLPAL
eukprot:gb/GEZN01010586.1/.p1 GENE.gb/GEZN01010586.1/~~gb/GEZN01010586.1/.p1  ORF type:complete len:363 (-),score=53.65 gb/GEZN01010586.1/:101-1189(-)